MNAPASRRPVRGAGDTMVRYGQAVMRSSSVYAVGVGILVPLGLVSLAITTRYLNPADYGRLAILFATASILTILAGLGILQGTLMRAYRDGADDEDGDGDADVVEEDVAGLPALTSAERKRIFTSGAVLATVATAFYVAPLAVLAGPISTLLLGDDQWAGAVRWMLASVWAGSIWRLVHQVWRFERRPQIWVFYQAFRPVLVIVLSAWALHAGYGIEGVLAATAAGTIVTIVISVAASRRNFVLRPRLSDVWLIYRQGLKVAPIILASLTQGHLSVFVVAATSSAETVGIFQVAAKLAMVPAYFGDGVFLGWPTLSRGPLGRAAVELRGRAASAAFIFKLMALSMLALLVLMSLSVGVLIHVAADEYRSAADLVPLLAAGAIGHVLFRAVYRTSRFPRRRTWYVVLHFVWIAPYAFVIAIVAPSHPTWAVASAQVVASAVVTTIMVLIARRTSTDPVPYPWARLALALLVGIACVAAVELSGTDDIARFALSVVAIVVFPVALVATRAVQKEQALIAGHLIIGLVPWKTPRSRVVERLNAMGPAERRAFTAVLWDQRSPMWLAEVEGVPEDVVLARVARSLRVFGEVPGRGGPGDVELARYVLHPGTTLERDDVADHLARSGIEPYELHRLEHAMVEAQRVRRRDRRASVSASPVRVDGSHSG